MPRRVFFSSKGDLLDAGFPLTASNRRIDAAKIRGLLPLAYFFCFLNSSNFLWLASFNSG
jgi:hypothetical protein